MSQADWDLAHLHPVSGARGWEDAALHRSGSGVERESAPDPGETYVQALLREREGYVRRGLADRVAAVDVELTRLGHSSPTGEQARIKPPARKGRARKVADDDA